MFAVEKLDFKVFLPHCFDYCSLVGSFLFRNCESSNFFSLFQECLALLDPLNFHVNLRISLYLFVQKQNFDRDCVESVDQCEKYCP